MLTKLHILGFPPVTYSVHLAQRGSAHFVFVGAALDAFSSAAGVQLAWLVILAKWTLAIGAFGALALQTEEHRHNL